MILPMKIKIGTQMDERIFRALKVAAARENKSIGLLLEEAVSDYIARHRSAKAKTGLRRFLDTPPARVSPAVFQEILRADPYDP
jgi:hypothetical protein